MTVTPLKEHGKRGNPGTPTPVKARKKLPRLTDFETTPQNSSTCKPAIDGQQVGIGGTLVSLNDPSVKLQARDKENVAPSAKAMKKLPRVTLFATTPQNTSTCRNVVPSASTQASAEISTVSQTVKQGNKDNPSTPVNTRNTLPRETLSVPNEGDTTPHIEHAYARANTPTVGGQMAISRPVLASLPDDSIQLKAKELFRNKQFMQAMENLIVIDINYGLQLMCQKTEPGPSVLQIASGKQLAKLDLFGLIIEEMEKHSPFLLKVLKTLCMPCGTNRNNVLVTTATMYAMGMHSRFPTGNTALQRLNSCAIVRYHGNNAILEILNKSNITLSKSNKMPMLVKMGAAVTSGIVEGLRHGKTGKLTVDNIDGRTIAYQIRRGHGNVEYHYTAATFYFDRVELLHLPMTPVGNPRHPDMRVFFLSVEGETMT